MKNKALCDKKPSMTKETVKDAYNGNCEVYMLCCEFGYDSMNDLTYNDIKQIHQYCGEFIREKEGQKKGGRR